MYMYSIRNVECLNARLAVKPWLAKADAKAALKAETAKLYDAKVPFLKSGKDGSISAAKTGVGTVSFGFNDYSELWKGAI